MSDVRVVTDPLPEDEIDDLIQMIADTFGVSVTVYDRCPCTDCEAVTRP